MVTELLIILYANIIFTVFCVVFSNVCLLYRFHCPRLHNQPSSSKLSGHSRYFYLTRRRWPVSIPLAAATAGVCVAGGWQTPSTNPSSRSSFLSVYVLLYTIHTYVCMVLPLCCVSLLNVNKNAFISKIAKRFVLLLVLLLDGNSTKNKTRNREG